MRLLVAAWLLATTSALPAFAGGGPAVLAFRSSDGISFYLGETTDGTIFMAPENDTSDIYVLSPDCVTKSVNHGDGSWGYDAGGWQISFGLAFEIYFPQQVPPINPSDCQMLR
jgi:hypothetical protein